MLNLRAIIPLIFIFSLSRSTKSQNSSHSQCFRTCATNKSGWNPVPYPFGFSDGCPIRLNCRDGEVSIDEYRVTNFTGNTILINFPAKCNRPFQEIGKLFGPNYAPTLQNGLMFQHCIPKHDGCIIPVTTIETQFRLKNCGAGTDNITCYSAGNEDSEFMSLTTLRQMNCSFFFGSVAVGNSSGVGEESAAVALQFQAAELGWWLKGNCSNNSCSSEANCMDVKDYHGGSGFRCHCRDGLVGDGFVDGEGCRKAPRCSASKYLSGKCGGKGRIGVLTGGIIVGVLVMAALAFICFVIQRWSRSLRNQMSAKRLLCEAAGSSCVPFVPYKEIERATNSFSEKQRLGTGAYGTVYAGKLHHDEWVAIKKIRHRDTDSIDKVMNEIKLLSSVSHPNLVRLLGCCIENNEQILVYEFMPNGTLAQHLQKERGTILPWTIRLTIATETANAIAYLHSTMNPPIYHRDIKSSNILLDFKFNSKVADFGLSRLGMIDDSHISTAPQGTPGYVDPQYHQNFHLSDKSDVYSFGVVLVEIITALKVVDFSRPHSEVNLAALATDRIGKGRVDDILDPFLEPNRDAWTLSSIHKVAELAFRCLAFHRDVRPSMMEVANELEQIRLSSWAPMDENLGMASSVASSNGSERSLGSISIKRLGVGSRSLVVSKREADCLTSLEEVKDCSPVSLQETWASEQSSPSTNSLLSNVVH
ncbi:Non-specific serine/threonine protein kinase [Bertholletia excelsa]